MHGVATNMKNVPNTPDFPHYHLLIIIMTHRIFLKVDKGPSHAAVKQHTFNPPKE
jgi:hypothetical protein